MGNRRAKKKEVVEVPSWDYCHEEALDRLLTRARSVLKSRARTPLILVRDLVARGHHELATMIVFRFDPAMVVQCPVILKDEFGKQLIALLSAGDNPELLLRLAEADSPWLYNVHSSVPEGFIIEVYRGEFLHVDDPDLAEEAAAAVQHRQDAAAIMA